jgi:hypothetical protein
MAVRAARAADFEAVLDVWKRARKGARRISALVADDEPEAGALWQALGYEHNAHLSRFVKNV